MSGKPEGMGPKVRNELAHTFLEQAQIALRKAMEYRPGLSGTLAHVDAENGIAALIKAVRPGRARR